MQFAYLIMVHDSMEQLRLLLRLLDHYENDIYLHIDKKSDIHTDSLLKCLINLD